MDSFGFEPATSQKVVDSDTVRSKEHFLGRCRGGLCRACRFNSGRRNTYHQHAISCPTHVNSWAFLSNLALHRIEVLYLAKPKGGAKSGRFHRDSADRYEHLKFLPTTWSYSCLHVHESNVLIPLRRRRF